MNSFLVCTVKHFLVKYEYALSKRNDFNYEKLILDDLKKAKAFLPGLHVWTTFDLTSLLLIFALFVIVCADIIRINGTLFDFFHAL